MKLQGKIEINLESKTVSIFLDNESWCCNQYPQGVYRFLEDEINYLLEGKKICWDGGAK